MGSSQDRHFQIGLLSQLGGLIPLAKNTLRSLCTCISMRPHSTLRYSIYVLIMCVACICIMHMLHDTTGNAGDKNFLLNTIPIHPVTDVGLETSSSKTDFTDTLTTPTENLTAHINFVCL